MSLPELINPQSSPMPISPPPPPNVASDIISASPPTVTVPAPQPQMKVNAQVVYPPGQFPNLHPGSITPAMLRAGDSEKDTVTVKTKEQYLNDLAHSPDSARHKLTVRRIKPAVWQGARLPMSALDDVEVLPHDTLTEMIRELHGGGEYTIHVRDSERNVVNALTIYIDPIQHPPKVPQHGPVRMADGEPGMLPGGAPGMAGFNAGSGLAGRPAYATQLEELDKLKLEEQKQNYEEAAHKAALRRLKAEREFNKEANRDQEEGESVRTQEIQALREETRNMFQGLKDVLATVLSKKEDPTLPLLIKSMEQSQEKMSMMAREQSESKEKTFALLMESMRQSNMQMMAILENSKKEQAETMKTLTIAMAPKPQNEMAEAMKVVVAANEKVAQMAVQNAGKAAGFSDKLFEMIVTNKLTSNETNLRQMMDLMDRGREQAMDMMRLQSEMGGGGGGGGEVINPEGGFLSNFGNVLLAGLSRIVSGAGGGAGSRLAAALMPQSSPLALPAPAPQHLLPAPSSVLQPVQAARSSVLVPYNEEPAPQTVQQPVQQPVYQSVQQPAVQPVQHTQTATVDQIRTIYADAEIGEGAVAQAAQPVQQAVPAVAADPDLSEHVTEAMRMAIADVTAGRSNQDWADYAGGKWGNFIGSLLTAADDAGRLRMIQAQCTPDVFQQLQQTLGANPAGLRNFVASLHGMLQEYQQERMAVA